MSLPAAKGERERLLECVQIRERLQALGALTDERTRQLLKERMNAFVRDGAGSTFAVRIAEGAGGSMSHVGDMGSRGGGMSRKGSGSARASASVTLSTTRASGVELRME